VTSPIAPCSGCGLRDDLCRCLEEQAAANLFYVGIGTAMPTGKLSRQAAKAQKRNEAQQSLAARREARRQARKEET
jgi:hypothetical protein